MTKAKIKKKYNFSVVLFSAALLFGTLISFSFVSAQSCPGLTTVRGTTVTFVSELTDMGGDITTSVWFDYGATIGYGQKTAEQALAQTGMYCTAVSGLSPCAVYHYRAAARNSAGASYGEDKTFTTACGPAVDIKAYSSDGPITIAYGSSAALTWNSANANYCSASGAWSGAKAISGSESTGNLVSSKSYVVTCTGSGGSNTDSVTINVSTAASLTVNKLVRNLSKGTAYFDSVTAEPFDVVSFSIDVTAGNYPLDNVIVKETLTDKIVYRSNSFKIDGGLVNGDIISGYNIGAFAANQKKTVAFDADILGADKFSFGETRLVNTVLVSNASISGSDTAAINVKRSAVAGAATEISTGLTNDLFLDSFVLPLAIASLMIWFFKSRIIKFEEWLDGRKNQYQKYKSKKLLQLRIKKIRFQELLKKYSITKS